MWGVFEVNKNGERYIILDTSGLLTVLHVAPCGEDGKTDHTLDGCCRCFPTYISTKEAIILIHHKES